MFEARVFGGESLQAVDGSASATRRLSVGRLGHPRSGVEGRGLLRRLAVLERAVADAGVSAPSPSLSQSLGRRSLAQTDGDMSPEEEFMLEQFPYCHSNIKLLADYNRDYVTDGTYQGDIFAYAMNQRIEYPQSDKDRYRPYVYKDEKQRRTFDRVTCVVTFNFPEKVSCSVDSAQFTVDGKEVTRFTIMKWSHKNCKFWFPPAPGTNPPEPGTIKDPVLPWFEILTCIQRPCPKRPSTEDKPIPKPNNDNKDPKPKPKPEPIEEPKPKPDPKPQPKPEPIEEPKPKPDPKPQPNEPPCKCKCPSDNDPPKSDPIKDPVGPGKPKTDPADDEKKRLHEYCGGLLLEQNAYTTEALKRIPKDEWYKYASNIRTEDKQGVKLCFLRYTIPTLSSDSNPDTPRVCELGSQVAPVKNSNPKKNYVQFILITGAILTSTPAPGKKPTIVFDCNYMFNTDTILHQNPTFQ